MTTYDVIFSKLYAILSDIISLKKTHIHFIAKYTELDLVCGYVDAVVLVELGDDVEVGGAAFEQRRGRALDEPLHDGQQWPQVVAERRLHFQHAKLGQVASAARVLRPEGRTEGEHLGQASVRKKNIFVFN